MARKLLNPNSIDSKNPPLLDLRRALIDIWSLVSELPVSVVDTDYTTTGKVDKEIIVASNVIPLTIYLNPTPKDGEEVIIKRQNAEITIDGNGNTIDGESSFVLAALYDAPHLVYTDLGGEWSMVGFLGFPRDGSGRIRVADEDTKESLQTLAQQIKLLNDRFEEAFETHISDGDLENVP
jgi:hypothetical protein